MSDKRKHIDDYFADALEGHAEDDLDLNLGWKGVESNLNSFSFFKFQINRFNVYYLALIGVVLSAMLVVSLRREKDLPISPLIIKKDTSSVSSAKKSNEELNLSLDPSERPMQATQGKIDKRITENEYSSFRNSNTSPAIDTGSVQDDQRTTPAILITEDVVQEKKDTLAKPKIKPPVVINRKRDTIIKIDTVFTNKRKKNK